MAQKANRVQKRRLVGSAIGGAVVPGMSGVQTYKGGRQSGQSKARAGAAGVGVGLGTMILGPGQALGAFAGAMRSQQKQSANLRNAKTGVRTSKPTPVRPQGRVGKR